MAKRRTEGKSAWVITHEDTQGTFEVVGILPRRKSAAFVKEYVEMLRALLYSSPRTHLNVAYEGGAAFEAEYQQTNTGARVQNLIHCGDRRYLVARLASDVELDDENGPPVLKWRNPDMPICDESTGMPIGKREGLREQAPVRLPLFQ